MPRRSVSIPWGAAPTPHAALELENSMNQSDKERLYKAIDLLFQDEALDSMVRNGMSTNSARRVMEEYKARKIRGEGSGAALLKKILADFYPPVATTSR